VDSLQPLVPNVPQFSEKFFARGIASPAERGADVVKPAVYPFKCIEWDLATGTAGLRTEPSRQLRRALSPSRSVSG
jgi:hypothetical protein